MWFRSIQRLWYLSRRRPSPRPWIFFLQQLEDVDLCGRRRRRPDITTHVPSSLSSSTITTTTWNVSWDSQQSWHQEIQESNQRTQGQIELRKTTCHGGGYGVFALQDWKRGQVLMVGRILSSSSIPHSHTIQTDWNTHVVMDLPARMINHSCRANVGILTPTTYNTTTTNHNNNDYNSIIINNNNSNQNNNSNDKKLKQNDDDDDDDDDDTTTTTTNTNVAYIFVALMDISSGNELLWDYETAEYDMRHSMICTCGSTFCRGTIQGYKYHGPIVRSWYGDGYMAPYLFQPRPFTKL